MADELMVLGIEDVKRALNQAGKTIRVKAVRGALREAGKVFQAAARAASPVLAVPTKRRKSGTVKRNIVVRNSKFAKQKGNEGVYVSVRGIRGSARVRKLGKAGASNPNDPFYWRFLELGTRKMAAKPFMRPAATHNSQRAVSVFMAAVVPQINKLNNRVKSK